jgi:sodium/proline symporter
VDGKLLIAFSIYCGLLLTVGVLAYRRARNATDFVLGNRSLNFYVTALSAHAADMSAWLFMAYPAAIFLKGGGAAWTAVGLLGGMWANWHFIAPKLRAETGRTGSLTLTHYFAVRFDDRRGILRAIGAASSLLFMTAYVAAGLVGIGCLTESVFGIERVWGITIGLSVVIAYALIGGYLSVCWVDLFQALFLLTALMLVPIAAFQHVGGATVIREAALERGVALSLMPQEGLQGLLTALLLSLGWGLGYFGQPHILAKFMAIGDPRQLRKSKRLGMCWQLLSLAAATAVGLVALAFFEKSPDNPELIFVEMVKGLFNPLFAGLILCAILAAAISTMDSQLLVLAPVLSEDVYHRLFHRKPSDRTTLLSSRLSLLFLGGLSYLIARYSAQTVMSLVFYSWSGLGSTFGPVLLMALSSRRVNWAGAVSGMVFGAAVAAFWPMLSGHWSVEIPTLIPGFLLNLGVIYAVSVITGRASARQSALE